MQVCIYVHNYVLLKLSQVVLIYDYISRYLYETQNNTRIKIQRQFYKLIYLLDASCTK